LPVISLAAAVAVESKDTGMLDCLRKGMWRWKEKQVAKSIQSGTFVECNFVFDK
jgi:hypothetical protein